MNKSDNLHCSLGERRLAQQKNEMKNILTQDGFTLCTLKNTSTLRS